MLWYLPYTAQYEYSICVLELTIEKVSDNKVTETVFLLINAITTIDKLQNYHWKQLFLLLLIKQRLQNSFLFFHYKVIFQILMRLQDKIDMMTKHCVTLCQWRTEDIRKRIISETKARESTLCNEALSQLSVICLSLSFLHIYIEGVHCTFTTFNNQFIDEDYYTSACI